MKFSVSNVAVALGMLLLGAWCGPRPEPPPAEVITRVDTVPPTELLETIRNGALENTRLNRIIRGYESRPPVTITRTDTLIAPPDTVLMPLVKVEGQTLLLAPLIADSTGPMLRPELHRFDVSGCDDGFTWNAGEFICDKPRFGHLSLFAEASLSTATSKINFRPEAYAGAEWTPTHRSPWRVRMGLDEVGLLTATVARRWTLF